MGRIYNDDHLPSFIDEIFAYTFGHSSCFFVCLRVSDRFCCRRTHDVKSNCAICQTQSDSPRLNYEEHKLKKNVGGQASVTDCQPGSARAHRRPRDSELVLNH